MPTIGVLPILMLVQTVQQDRNSQTQTGLVHRTTFLSMHTRQARSSFQKPSLQRSLGRCVLHVACHEASGGAGDPSTNDVQTMEPGILDRSFRSCTRDKHVQHMAVRRTRIEVQNRTRPPIGSIVVPFWDYIIGFYIKPQKGTTLEPLGKLTGQVNEPEHAPQSHFLSPPSNPLNLNLNPCKAAKPNPSRPDFQTLNPCIGIAVLGSSKRLRQPYVTVRREHGV